MISQIPTPAEHGVEIHTADNIFIKQIVVPDEGSFVPQHAHVWDHTTMIAAGGMHVWQDGVYVGMYLAPTALFIKAGVKHTFRTIEQNTVLLCIHNLMHPDAVAVLAEHHLTPDDAAMLVAGD